MVMAVEQDDDSFGKLLFTADSHRCKVDYETLVKEFGTVSLPKTYTPIVVFDFLKATGPEFITEETSNNEGETYLARSVNGFNVKFTVIETENDITEYLLCIQ